MEIEETTLRLKFTAEEIIDQILLGYEEDDRFPGTLPSTYKEAIAAGWELALIPTDIEGNYLLKISRKA